MFLHNGNKFPSVPVTHAANIIESYENSKPGFETIQYEKYNWNRGGGIVETENIFTLKKSGQNENRLFQDRKLY